MGGFVGGFGWFWVVLGRFGWFWVVPCFSNYAFFGDFISKNINIFRESSCSTKKSYGIEILSMHFSLLCVSKEVKYFEMC